MSYLDTINMKKSEATVRAQAQSELDALIAQLKEVQLASLMNNKTSVILADSTDFGEKMAELGTKIEKVLKEFRDDTASEEKLNEIANDYKKLAVYQAKVNKEQSEEIKKTLNNLVKALESIKLPELPKIPAVKIPAFPKIPTPIVNVPKTDLSPLTEAIESLKEDGIDLDCYKAHDINDGKEVQYIGFLNPEGNWYIIENKVKENRIRYVFGKSNYTKAFAKAPTYQYELLSEAVNAL